MFNIRKAQQTDAKTILEFIYKIAEYEKMTKDVVNTEDLIKKVIFEEKAANCLMLEYEQKVIGYAIYFFNYSTFEGKKGLYLEDVFIDMEHRKKGFGKQVLKYLANVALENDCARMEWSCLKWNKPSIEFYESLNAFTLDEWHTFRLTKENINILAKDSEKNGK